MCKNTMQNLKIEKLKNTDNFNQIGAFKYKLCDLYSIVYSRIES